MFSLNISFSWIVLLLLSLLTATRSFPSETSSYIVITNNNSRPSHFVTQELWYSSILHSLSTTTSKNTQKIFYTYDTVMKGFAATMTSEESELVSKLPGVIGVHRDVTLHLQTTRSPDFIGLNDASGLWPEANFGDDVIIGLVDTGIWPESASFSDEGLQPIGEGWKGECEEGTLFDSTRCNNKLIGARYFSAGRDAMGSPILETEYRSPRDAGGHGTHTSSIAAGSPVPGANLFGWANGTARGMAPKARIAMYKACWVPIGCAPSDVLAAIEKAIDDGVHILSLSLSNQDEVPYHSDLIAIGAFAALRRGIFVAFAAGNFGHVPGTVRNTAPWVTTVAAGSLDRRFHARVRLGNGEFYEGESLCSQTVNGNVPIVSIGYCSNSTVSPADIKGKIVACQYDALQNLELHGHVIQEAGGEGIILLNTQSSGDGIFILQALELPSLVVGYSDGEKIISYITSSENPMASLEIHGGAAISVNRAPKVAGFSSRGPGSLVPEILKPDILAPGINILAAWREGAPPDSGGDDPRRSGFNVISGTSMACPHVAGIAALLRKTHPSWSPAMIRSAIMTTAVSFDNRQRPIAEGNWEPATPLAYGAGHVNPQMAMDPGLVYDAGIDDYVNLLCTLNYTDDQLKMFVHGPITCSKFDGGPGDLNYPSFSVVFNADDTNSQAKLLKRTLTMVSQMPETYRVRVVNPMEDMVGITVEPTLLKFEKIHQRREYVVKFTYERALNSKASLPPTEKVFKHWQHGMIIWESKEHVVRTPVVFA